MKVCSPLFAVVIIAATVAPRVDAACAAVCTTESGCVVKSIPVGTSFAVTAPSAPSCTAGQYLTSFGVSYATGDTLAVTFNNTATTSSQIIPTPTATAVSNIDCANSYSDVGMAITTGAQAILTCTSATGSACTATYLPAWNCVTPPASGTCNAVCTAGQDCTTGQSNANSQPLVITASSALTCDYGQYLQSFKVSSTSTDVFAVTFADSTAPTSAVATAETMLNGCAKTYADVGKGLVTTVKGTVTCANAASGNTPAAACTFATQATWLCNPTPTCAAVCGASDIGCVTSKRIPAAAPFVLTAPTTGCANGWYLSTLKVSNANGDNLAVTFKDSSTTPALVPAPTPLLINPCAKSYTDAGKGLATSVQAIFTCSNTGGTDCNVAYQPTWTCNATPATCAAVCTTGTGCTPSQVIKAGQSFDVTPPTTGTSCATSQYLQAFKVSSGAATDKITVTFTDTATTPAPLTAPASTATACGKSYANVGMGLKNSVKARISCGNDAGSDCTVAILATYACNGAVPNCAVACNDNSDPGCTSSAVPNTQPLSLTLTTNPKCPSGQYLSSLKVSGASGDVFTVAFTDTSTQPVPVVPPETALSACGKSYTDVGIASTSSTVATITCANTGGQSPANCAIVTQATWACLPPPTCAAACASTDTGCVSSAKVKVGTPLTISAPVNSICPYGQYLLGLKVSSSVTDALAVTFKDTATKPNTISTIETIVTACSKSYTDVGKTLMNDIQAILTCSNAKGSDGTTPDCTVAYQPTWACKPLPTCATICVAGDPGCAPTASLSTSTPVTITAPSTPTCNYGKYLSSLKVSYLASDSVTVAFTDSATNHPAAVAATASLANACAKTYTNVGMGLATNVQATITCTNSGSTSCNVAYQTTWACNPTPPTCAQVCTGTANGCVASKPVPVNSPLTFNAPTAACTPGYYLSSLKVSGGPNDKFSVSFTDSASTPGAIYAAPTTTSACSQSFTNVGKGGATNVQPTITCANTAPSGGGTAPDCTITYQPTWVCNRDTTALCGHECATADGCTALASIAAAGTKVLRATNTDQCPGKSYLRSLKIGAGDQNSISMTFQNAGSNIASTSNDGTCYYEYGQVPSDTSVLTTTPMTATVTCAPGNSAACATVQALPVWGCIAGTCPTPCPSCTDQFIDANANFVIQKPSTLTCATGSFAYPKNLYIAGKYGGYKVVPTFNTKVAPTPDAKDSDCYFAYTNPFGSVSTVPSADVTVTVTCKDSANPCTAQYKADWDCYNPPDLTKTYTRTGPPTGANCGAVSDCAYRCAKSYALGGWGSTSASRTLMPQVVGADCTCPVLTATATTGSETTAWTNANALLSVAFAADASTMTLTYTGAAACVSTYAKANFTNGFSSKTYSRQSSSATPSTDCDPTSNEYKCSSELTVTKMVDSILAVQTAVVTGVTCTNSTDYVSDSGTSASGGTSPVTYFFNVTSTGFTLDTTTTTAASGSTPASSKTCRGVYIEKVAAPPPPPPPPGPTAAPPPGPSTAPSPTTTTKTGTGTSAGVSATAGDVVTVTLAAAVAGAVAGMPVNA